MSNPFEDLRQAVVIRPMNSPGPQGAAGPKIKIQYSNDGLSWHDNPVETDQYMRFSTDNGVTWCEPIHYTNLPEMLELVAMAKNSEYKAHQWAENPENVPVIEPDQFSALHHASQAARSETNAEAAALDAELAAIGAFGVPPMPWNSTTVYNYNDIVNFGNGHIYRCIGTNIVGANHAPNIDGIDNEEDWVRITVVLDGYFEVDENGDFMPMIAPTNSEIFMLDENGDITYQDPIDIEVSRVTIENFTLDENGDIAYRDPTDHRPGSGNIELYKEMEFVDSIADLRSSYFYGTTKYVYVAGYYGAGTPGGGVFYKDPDSTEPDNGGTIIIGSDGVRWKRANVHEEYYASWFGVSTDIEDNSPLIQNIFNIIPLGSILIFGPGTYKCKQTITFPYRYDIPYIWPYKTIGISIQGSGKMPMFRESLYPTKLRYTGPNPDTPTPFFDFRCAFGPNWKHTSDSGNQYFCGSIRNIEFIGLGANSNIIGLWFYRCIGSLFDSVQVRDFKEGIRVDSWYFYCKFNDVTFSYNDIGFRSIGNPNKAVFNYCNFITGHIGFQNSASGSGVQFNACYFEHLDICIKYSPRGGTLCINQCHVESFERLNRECIISLYKETTDPITKSSIVIENSYIAHNVLSAYAIIRQDVLSDDVISYVINNNYIVSTDPLFSSNGKFIDVINGNLVIEARNNVLMDNPYPICSVVPSDSYYFNNDFIG